MLDRRRLSVQPGPPAGEVQLPDAHPGRGRAVVGDAGGEAQGLGPPGEEAHLSAEGGQAPAQPVRLGVEALHHVPVTEGPAGEEGHVHLAGEELPPGGRSHRLRVAALVPHHVGAVYPARLAVQVLQGQGPVAGPVEGDGQGQGAQEQPSRPPSGVAGVPLQGAQEGDEAPGDGHRQAQGQGAKQAPGELQQREPGHGGPDGGRRGEGHPPAEEGQEPERQHRRYGGQGPGGHRARGGRRGRGRPAPEPAPGPQRRA